MQAESRPAHQRGAVAIGDPQQRLQVGLQRRDPHGQPDGRALALPLCLPEPVVVLAQLRLQARLAQDALCRLGLRERCGAAETRQHRALALSPVDVEAELLQPRVRQRSRPAAEDARVGRVAERRCGRGGEGMKAHGHLEDRAEGAERAGEELRQVVARDVLDHLAAALCDRAVGQRDPHADDKVPHPAVARPQGPRVVCRHHSADGGVRAGRVQGQHLILLGERLLGAGQRHARLEGRGEVACVVFEDAIEARAGELERRIRSGRPGQLGAGAVDPHAFAGLVGGAQLLRHLLGRRRCAAPGGLRLHQKRSANPASSSGWRRYSPGTSPHRRGVGITLPGLARWSGSNAQRRRWNAPRSASENWSGM